MKPLTLDTWILIIKYPKEKRYSIEKKMEHNPRTSVAKQESIS